eukprot:6122449-Amphidinium_carterae.1
MQHFKPEDFSEVQGSWARCGFCAQEHGHECLSCNGWRCRYFDSTEHVLKGEPTHLHLQGCCASRSTMSSVRTFLCPAGLLDLVFGLAWRFKQPARFAQGNAVFQTRMRFET